MSLKNRLGKLVEDASLLLFLQARWIERPDDNLEKLRGVPLPATKEEKLTYDRLVAQSQRYLTEVSQVNEELQDTIGG